MSSRQFATPPSHATSGEAGDRVRDEPLAALRDEVAARVGRLVHDLRNPLNVIAMNAELVGLVAGGEAPSSGLDSELDALGRAVGELEARLADLDGYVAELRGSGDRGVGQGGQGGQGE